MSLIFLFFILFLSLSYLKTYAVCHYKVYLLVCICTTISRIENYDCSTCVLRTNVVSDGKGVHRLDAGVLAVVFDHICSLQDQQFDSVFKLRTAKRNTVVSFLTVTTYLTTLKTLLTRLSFFLLAILRDHICSLQDQQFDSIFKLRTAERNMVVSFLTVTLQSRIPVIVST